MKKYISLLFSIVCFFSFAQNSGKVYLEWLASSKISYNTFEVNVPQFAGKNFQLDLGKNQIYCNLNLPQKEFVNENSLQISNIVYQPISIAELGELDINAIPNAINATLINGIAREEVTALIQLSPIIKEGNSFKKIISFDYSFANGNFNRAPQGTNTITSSVLATGNWYRFYVTKSGAYSITKTFLQQLGLGNGFDPRNLKIYGGGGRMLPHANSANYPFDIPEIAIQVNGESDGVFNDGDSVVFYAEGMDNWSEENQTYGNLYADKSYYYITTDGGAGKRMPEMMQPTGTPAQIFTTFDDETYHETDLVNIGKLGRRWFGEDFKTNNVQTFNFNIPNAVSGSQLNIKVYGAAYSSVSTTFNIEANGTAIGSISPSAVGSYTAYTFAENSFNFLATDNVALKITYNNNGVPTSAGYLDYISIKSKRNLTGYGKQFRFQNNLSTIGTGIANYQISNASAIGQVWNISDIYNVSKTSNSSATFSFKDNMGTLQKYIAVDNADLFTPLKDMDAKVGNQDLKGTIFKDENGINKDIDYLIIAPSFLLNSANKLANFHKNNSGMNVKVVSLDIIYQEFASGKQDIGAIRNFVKYVYDNAIVNKIKYLNLFGDASYDFKNTNNRTKGNTNIVPIYHALNSSTLGESSFCSDDFYGLMNANEGVLSNSFFTGLDVAVGRMIVSTNEQADQMVNKVVEYYDRKSYGSWRNTISLVADDADSTSDVSLQTKQNSLADEIVLNKTFFNAKKIWLDAYLQETTAGGNRYPKAREDFFNAFANGSLVVNYLGHGGQDGLAQEHIWDKTDGQSLSNQYKYPLFITLTCDFSRFDNPLKQTAGEFTYWNPKGGSIAMLTTVREIGQTGAEIFNPVLASKLFSYGSNTYYSIGESLRLAKNAGGSSASNLIFCIGDPALMLAIPKPKVILTKVNDMPISGPIDDLKSLSYTKLSGEIVDEFNVPFATYKGDLAINIFDKDIPRTTLNNDGQGSTMIFKTLGETIFRGNASVTNGKFEFGFVVPRDIRIPVGNGKISFYAKQNNAMLDNTGYNTDIKVGGVNLLAAADTTPPKVRLYMNDETFVNGGISNQSPIFLAFMEDENGINTASGIGHDIVAVLDGKITLPYVLNDYYETELNNYKKGKLRYQFRNLALGLHTLTFKAWDVYNNLVTSEIQFVVVGNETLTLTNVLNYPNPFVNYTQFWFTHNRPFEPLEVQVQVMTVTGKILWTKNETVTTTGFLSREITWDGKDDFGDKLGKGVYIYKLKVKSVLTDTVTEKYEKLVIL